MVCDGVAGYYFLPQFNSLYLDLSWSVCLGLYWSVLVCLGLGRSWHSMVFNGIQWSWMVSEGHWWSWMVCLRLSQNTINIARNVNAVQYHSYLSGNTDCHVMSSQVLNCQDFNQSQMRQVSRNVIVIVQMAKNCQNCLNCQNCQILKTVKSC